MSIENILTRLAAAIEANTDAMVAMNATSIRNAARFEEYSQYAATNATVAPGVREAVTTALLEASSSAVAEATAEKDTAPEPETPAVVVEPEATPAGVVEPEATPEPEATVAVEPQLSPADKVKMVREAILNFQSVKGAVALKALLAEFNAIKLSQVPSDKQDDLVARAATILAGG